LGKGDGIENQNPERILLIKFFGIGSIIYISPSIRALRDKYPNAKISFLTFAEHTGLCEMIDGIDNVITFKIRGLINLIKDVPLLILKLRKEKFDRVYNFEFHARFPTIVSYLSGAREMTEFHSDFFYKGNLRSKKIPYTLDRHVISSFMDMVSDNHSGLSNLSINLSLQALSRELNIPASDERYIDSFLAYHIKPANPPSPPFSKGGMGGLIGVNINTSGMAYERRWHIKKFTSLIELLINRYDAYIFLTGGKGDFNYVSSLKEFFKNNERVINTAGKLSLKQLAALYKRCNLVISNDSGPLHIAEAVGTKTVSLFGPETPAHYGPIGENHTVIYKALPCSPCLSPLNMKSANCNIGVKCMESITVDEVFSAVRGMLR
ncbi:MAG: glycosyltransferase family 9 protein, partial [Nitrospinae bacterium]|nr:glycosyltransferase family 9 protein [Nitrospinota bacterium]